MMVWEQLFVWIYLHRKTTKRTDLAIPCFYLESRTFRHFHERDTLRRIGDLDPTLALKSPYHIFLFDRLQKILHPDIGVETINFLEILMKPPRFFYVHSDILSVDLKNDLWILIHRFFEALGREFFEIEDRPFSPL